MLVFVPAFVVLICATGFLWFRMVKLRQELRDARREATAGALFGSDKLAILREANEVLRAKNQRIQGRLDDLQGEFGALGYSISHDLRAPLRSVNGFAQALAEDYGPRLDATAQDYLRRVRAGALQMSALIDELLALARIVQGPFHPETVDLSALAWEAAHELMAADPARRAEWDIEPGMTAEGDRALLGTALRHLLGNAWKFSAGRATAHLSFRTATTPDRPSAKGSPVYEIRDDGVGFDMQYAGKLFGVFQRMHAASDFPGHGVGLATVQRILRRHGGGIRAAAEPGRGATFSFTLDASPDGEADGLPPAPFVPMAAVPTDAVNPAQPKPTVV